LSRQRFHRQRSAESPLASHSDPEQPAQNQKDREIRRERREQFHDRIENNVGHQRNAPAEFVAPPTEDERADRPHHQRQRDRKRDFRNALAELVTNWYEDEGNEKEIERVERPAKKAGDERVALIATQKFEKPKRFHKRNSKL